jgi:hypothetical protein
MLLEVSFWKEMKMQIPVDLEISFFLERNLSNDALYNYSSKSLFLSLSGWF